MNEFRVVIYTVLLACSIFAIDLNSASATSIDLKIENERVVLQADGLARPHDAGVNSHGKNTRVVCSDLVACLAALDE